MRITYFRDQKLSQSASDLLQFDIDSIQQVVKADRLPMPQVWLADPEAYERNGRVMRDSDSSRLLAYSLENQTVYATDGCNSCARRLPARLESLSLDQLRTFAEQNDLRSELLERLAAIVRRNT